MLIFSDSRRCVTLSGNNPHFPPLPPDPNTDSLQVAVQPFEGIILNLLVPFVAKETPPF